MDKVALVTGVTGQDGSYLAEFLISKGYMVVGTVRATISSDDERFKNLSTVIDSKNLIIESCDLCDYGAMDRIIRKYKPKEVYNLAAQSDVGESFKTPLATCSMNMLGVVNLLEVVRNSDPDIRMYQASTSEMFGDNTTTPQNEDTLFSPVSPYGVAKLAAHYMVRSYRSSYNMFAASGILFNHESPRRGENFVTRKITKAAARIKLGKQDKLQLGNLDAFRDWGFAGDYVKAMWLILQQDVPDDFVIASGETHSVRELLELVFRHADLSIVEHVNTTSDLYRPTEVPKLWGDPSKAEKQLGWKREMGFEDLIIHMYEEDLVRESGKNTQYSDILI
jgi:GDPmannose 4,6-dehydratase